ncbi:MAG TPA: hypothetical protein PK765_04870 [bacterium]|nr:hypothetical protein [bacterium]
MAVRSGIGTKASVVDTSVSIIRSLDGEPLISPAQINRILQRLVQEGIVAESDVRNIGAATLTEFRRRGITIK